MNLTPPPRQLSKYEIVAEIARDIIGVTYRGRDPVLDAPVALRVLAPYLAQDAAFMAQLRQEMRRARGLKHPHILALYDFGTDHDAVFLVTELIEGQTLAELLAGGQQMDIDRVLAIAEQVADALDYAHGQGAIHQDLKPANILIGPNDQVTVTGFGLARAMQGTLLAASQAYGTVAYWSPEQAEGQPATAASDQYSLAAIIFEMLTGRLPFTGETSIAVLRQIADKAAPAPRQFRKELPAAIDEVISGALAKKPLDRYPTGRSLTNTLSTVLGPSPASQPEGLVQQPAPTELAAPSAPSVVHGLPPLRLLGELRTPGDASTIICFNAAGTHLLSACRADRVDVFMCTTFRLLRSLPTQAAPLALDFPERPMAVLQSGQGLLWDDVWTAKSLFQSSPASDALWLRSDKIFEVIIDGWLYWKNAATEWIRTDDKVWNLPGSLRAAGTLTCHIRDLAGKDARIVDLASIADSAIHVGHLQARHKAGVPRLFLESVRCLDHDAVVRVCSFHPKGARLASGCEDGTIRIWDFNIPLELVALKAHEAPVIQIAFAEPDQLISASADGLISVWHVSDTPAVTHTGRHESCITALSYHVANGVLASADEKGIIRLWKLP
jgi:hypothetical protein